MDRQTYKHARGNTLHPNWAPSWLVGWLEFNAPFQHEYGYIRDEGAK